MLRERDTEHLTCVSTGCYAVIAYDCTAGVWHVDWASCQGYNVSVVMRTRRELIWREDQGMRVQGLWWSGLLAAVLGGLVCMTAAAGEQFLPLLGAREGASRSTGIPLANGFIDYWTLLNERDGGIHGV